MPDPAQTTTAPAPAPVPTPTPTSTAAAAPPAKISDADYAKLTTAERYRYASQHDQSKFINDPGKAGTAAEPAQPTTGDGTTAPAGSVQALDGGKFKIGEAEFSSQELLDLAARKGAEDSRRAALPDATAYRHELPKDLRLPNGVTFNFDANDPTTGPVLKSASEWAHRNGLGQTQYSELLGLYAASQADHVHKIAVAMEAQKNALGVAGPARIDALDMYVKGAFPEFHQVVMGKPGANGKGGGFGGMLWTAKQVEFLEAVVAKLTGQGAGGFSHSHREPPDNSGRVDQATYDRMSTGEKRAYAARFDQSQFQGR